MQSFPIEAEKRLSCIPILGAVSDWLSFTFTNGRGSLLFGLIMMGFCGSHYGLYLAIFSNPLSFYPIEVLALVALTCAIGLILKYSSSTVKTTLSSNTYSFDYGSILYTGTFCLLAAFYLFTIHNNIVSYYGDWDAALYTSYTKHHVISTANDVLAIFLVSYYCLLKPVLTSLFFIYVAKYGTKASTLKEAQSIETSQGNITIDWEDIRRNKLETFSGNRRKVLSGKIRLDSTKCCDDEIAEQFLWDFLQLNPKTDMIAISLPSSDVLGLAESYVVHCTKAALRFGFRAERIDFIGSQYIGTKDAQRLSNEIKQQFFEELAETEQAMDEYEKDKQKRTEQLDNMIGLHSVKEEVRRLNAMLTYNQQRKAEGLEEIDQGAYHMVFTGNPGTGKTVVARLIAQMLADKGVIRNNKVIEVTRSDLVAKYIGQTAPKVREVVDQAMGGVLFIDEAYTLSNGGKNDFGQEAIDELLKLMEDRRGEFVVITAGYQQQMDSFLQSNDGLKRRFSRFIQFEDFSDQELLDILISMATKTGDIIEAQLLQALPTLLSAWRKNYGVGFGNAGAVRQLLEAMQKSRPLRLIEDNVEMKGSALVTLTQKDWDKAVELTSFS
ncbi:AAA family ATPase [Vibrio sp. 10N.261.51.F11]|uniref:AAA family ATPase n=1 Tax=Vibrio sp. 10N.261.51.F11 TaxID=3229678 RepID=UPI003550E0A3